MIGYTHPTNNSSDIDLYRIEGLSEKCLIGGIIKSELSLIDSFLLNDKLSLKEIA